MAVLLGIDAGTTSVSVVAYDTALHGIAYHRQGLTMLTYPDCSPVRQDPSKILSCVKELIDPSIEPAAVCVTGQMHGFLLLAPSGRLLSHNITWEDTRIGAGAESDSGYLLPFEEMYSSSKAFAEGVRSGPGYTVANLFWLHLHGLLPAEDFTVCSIQDWLLYELSGRRLDRLTTDPSCAHSTGLFLPVSGGWDYDLAEEVGLKPHQLPAIALPGSIVGRSEGMNVIPDGVPLCVGLGDNQASFLASVGEVQSAALVNIGTGSQISVWTETYRPVNGLDVRPFLDGDYIIVGAPLCGGRAFAAVRDLVEEIGEIFFGVETGGEEIYRRLIERANLATDLICSPLFSGSRTDPDERGTLEHLTLDNFRIGDISAAVINGISTELYSLYKRADVQAARLIGSGNGIRRNWVLAESIRKVFSLPLQLAPFEEEAALGAALAAGVGVGAFPDFRAAGIEVHRYTKGVTR